MGLLGYLTTYYGYHYEEEMLDKIFHSMALFDRLDRESINKLRIRFDELFNEYGQDVVAAE